MPEALSFIEAASIPCAFLTAYCMVNSKAAVQNDESVLITAAGSGVGSAAIQFARLAGATVYVTAGSASKIDRAIALGAIHGVNYSSESVPDTIFALTRGAGVDVVIDTLAGQALEDAVFVLRSRGRLVSAGCTLGNWARVNIATLIGREITLHGVNTGSKAELVSVLDLFRAGKLVPTIDRVFPLSEIREAVQYLADRNQFGKVVMVPDKLR
jgi:NADPH:quinone reductase-like Zn-dependent oxidoreductase